MPIKVYYVDDEPDLLELFSEEFESDEVHISTFPNPFEAIQQIEKDTPHLLFVDYRMPLMTGDEMALKLNGSFPIALMTGELDLKPSYHFHQIFHKPYDYEELKKYIHSFL